jgi:hypothetical protein
LSCNRIPSFKLIDDQNPLGLLPLVKSINLKEGTRLVVEKTILSDCANMQPAPNCAHLPYKLNTAHPAYDNHQELMNFYFLFILFFKVKKYRI